MTDGGSTGPAQVLTNTPHYLVINGYYMGWFYVINNRTGSMNNNEISKDTSSSLIPLVIIILGSGERAAKEHGLCLWGWPWDFCPKGQIETWQWDENCWSSARDSWGTTSFDSWTLVEFYLNYCFHTWHVHSSMELCEVSSVSMENHGKPFF